MGERRRSQSRQSTAAVRAARGVESKAAPRGGSEEGGGVRSTQRQSESNASAGPARARQGAEARGQDWTWVEAGGWNERMGAALGKGVTGGQG